ncbi:MAG: alpha/beta hydrolase-fold protein [Bacteroidota bacterium]
MNKYIYSTFLFTFISIFSYSQVLLHISKVPNDTPDSDTLYFASSINNWRADDPKYAFTKDISGNYRLDIQDVSFPLEYKITRGNWNNVETDSRGNSIDNRTIKRAKAIGDSIEVDGWYDHLYKEENTLSKNVLILDDDFYMPQLNRNRRIWIYLPESYSSSDKKYPVLYMHDGQNLFNSASSFAGEWEVDETMDKLIAEGNREAIIVGIDNGGKFRIDELTPFENSEYGGGDGGKYVEFIVNTLKPFVDSKYRTLSDRENTAIMGSSLGGLISFYAILKFKNIFSKAGVMSPSFWFSERIYFIPQYRENMFMKVHFSAGDSESETMLLDIDKMIEKMKKMGYPDSSYRLKVVKDGKHNEEQWRKEFLYAYKWLMN